MNDFLLPLGVEWLSDASILPKYLNEKSSIVLEDVEISFFRFN